MNEASKSKRRKKELQISNTIEENIKMNSSLKLSKFKYKEKTMDKSKQNKIFHLNKLDQKYISKKELKFHFITSYSPLKLKQINKIGTCKSKLGFLLNIIIILLLICITNEISIFRKLNSYSSIAITFIESGDNIFLNKDFKPLPDYIWVHGEKQDFKPSSENKNHIILEEGEFTIKFGWEGPLYSCSNMFNGLTNIKSIDLSDLDTSQVTDMSEMFNGSTKLESLNLQSLNLSAAENLNSMFQSCYSLREIDLSNLDASHVTTMSGMFSQCSAISSINLSNLKLGSVIDMSYLFDRCMTTSKIDLSNINTQTVKNMSHLFYQCAGLRSLNLSNFDTSSVQDMDEMFSKASFLESLDLSNFNTKSLLSMKGMFFNCLNLIHLNISSFDTTSVTDMSEVFHSCSNLETLDISNFRTTKNTFTNGLFQDCTKLKSIILPRKLSSNNMKFMFQGCHSLTTLDLSHFDTSSVTNMGYMFNDCIELNYIDLSLIDTSSVISMENMFKNCEKLERIDLSKLDTSSLTSMNNMFYNCKSLLFLNLKSLTLTNIDVGDMLKKDISENLTLCYDENIATNLRNNYGSLIKDCDNDCFKESTKLISELKKCVDDCNKDGNTYRYEFNDKCYQKCPKNTILSNYKCLDTSSRCEYYSTLEESLCLESVPEGYYIFDNENKIIDECYKNCKSCNEKGYDDKNNCIACKEGYFYENGNCVESCTYYSFTTNNDIKVCSCSLNNMCKECSDESLQNGLCITCNERDDYFTKYSEKDNNFINCYKSLKGYKLIGSYFYPCYDTCDECSNVKGNESEHFCTSCKSGYKFINEVDHNGNCYKICNYFYYFDESNKYQCTYSNECPSNRNKLVEEKSKCVFNCRDDDTFQFEYNNKCYEECPDIENQIIDNFICKNKTEEIKTDKITSKITIDENTQKPTFHVIQTTEIAQKEVITDNIVIPTDKKTEKTIIYTTPTNRPTSKITQTTEMTDNIVIQTDKKTEKTIIYTTPTNRPTSKITQNTEKIIDIQTQNNEEKENWNMKDFFLGLSNENNKEILNKDEIIKKIKENIIKNNSLILNVIQGNKEDLSIKEDNVLYQITTTENQNNNTYNNISTIKLGKCEDILRLKYNISNNLSFIIFKIDYYMEGLLIPIIGYEVYHPLNFSKLDLSYCEDSLISYNIPVTIDEDNLFKYNPNSDYYNDECNTYTTKNGTDIILNDRKEDFKENNMSLCENLCNYMGYDKDTKKALCECGIRYKEFLLSEIDKQTDLLSNNFTKDETNSNLGTMKCYEVLFSKEGLLTNIGSYILLLIILIHTISTIIFYKCGYYLLENNVKNIIKKKKKEKPSKSTKKAINAIKSKTNNISPKNNSEKIKLKDKKNKNKNKRKNKSKANPLKKNKNRKNLVINQVNININNNNHSNSKSFSKLKIKDTDIFSPQSKKISNNNTKLKKYKKDKKKKKSNKIMSMNIYSDFELNIMDYNDALRIDNRTFFQYYCSLLKTKHSLIFTFFSNKDYNSLIIKICLFSLSFAIYYLFNAIFFNYSIIHIVYKDGGSYNLSHLFPIIIYAFLISYYINVIIKFFSLSERNLLELKNQKSIKQMNFLVPKVLRCLIIKYILYFVLSIIFLTFFWYYISSFGAVFQNSQVYLIKNTFISFALGLNYPFLIYLLPGIFRRLSLRAKNRKCIYKISNIFQNL